MGLLGSRATLIASLCALVVACVVIAQGAYIVHECRGYYRPQDIVPSIVPAIVMFIIRNWLFSFCFLALHVALSMQMFYQAQSIHLASYACGGRLGDPLGNTMLLFLVSIICLAVYLMIALVRLAISVIYPRE